MISGQPPFKTQVLEFDIAHIPATYRTKSDDILPAQVDSSLLQQELLVRRLNKIHRWMFWCGRPMPPRPLHHQTVISRIITVTERVDLHLVWSRNRIFVKPLPLFLLDPAFWSTHLLPSASSASAPSLVGKLPVGSWGATDQTGSTPPSDEIRACALGFLFSYTALVMHETDFRLAQDLGLLPQTISWPAWRNLCAEFLSGFRYCAINPRYWYGELRLQRLNLIWRIKTRSLWRGYSQVDSPSVYASFLSDHFASLATALAFLAIVLTAMQVGLATEDLTVSGAFQKASCVFTVFSILAPVAGVVALAGFVSVLAVSDFRTTERYAKRRFDDIGVSEFNISR
ncbi:hypothetical protein CGLO_16408 [Colletotrichum gloeosporioides Cg-14]|uniref:Uncharacterized protein n=1 Tax=Colletotrichum gloeosporioides (strain Cg-14) TaxID=1237896 RepID=T0JZ32_COLGC|nr:hypothetical protein CGLO_16408 [Colletotrichum gloeosporioides Cg-14]